MNVVGVITVALTGETVRLIKFHLIVLGSILISKVVIDTTLGIGDRIADFALNSRMQEFLEGECRAKQAV